MLRQSSSRRLPGPLLSLFLWLGHLLPPGLHCGGLRASPELSPDTPEPSSRLPMTVSICQRHCHPNLPELQQDGQPSRPCPHFGGRECHRGWPARPSLTGTVPGTQALVKHARGVPAGPFIPGIGPFSVGPGNPKDTWNLMSGPLPGAGWRRKAPRSLPGVSCAQPPPGTAFWAPPLRTRWEPEGGGHTALPSFLIFRRGQGRQSSHGPSSASQGPSSCLPFPSPQSISSDRVPARCWGRLQGSP